MKIGITCSMQEEINLLLADLERSESSVIGKREYSSGRLYGTEAVLVFSRWGKVASASTATTLIDRFGVEAIVFTGVAGAASPLLSIGDIVVSTALVQHDLDASALPAFAKFEIPLLGISRILADKGLIESMAESASQYISSDLLPEIGERTLSEFGIFAPKIELGLIASGDRFIADKGLINSLCEQLGDLLCVEMEGAAVAQVCYEHGVPFVVARAISDKADHSAVIDFPRFINKVACYYSRGIIRGLISKLGSLS